MNILATKNEKKELGREGRTGPRREVHGKGRTEVDRATKEVILQQYTLSVLLQDLNEAWSNLNQKVLDALDINKEQAKAAAIETISQHPDIISYCHLMSLSNEIIAQKLFEWGGDPPGEVLVVDVTASAAAASAAITAAAAASAAITAAAAASAATTAATASAATTAASVESETLLQGLDDGGGGGASASGVAAAAEGVAMAEGGKRKTRRNIKYKKTFRKRKQKKNKTGKARNTIKKNKKITKNKTKILREEKNSS